VPGVALALASALLFGGMSIALGFSMRRSRDALVGAFASAFSGFCVCGVVALIGREWGGELWPYFIAGLLAPGGAQLLFVLAVREAGPSRASVIAGAAPLVAVTIAILALGEPVRVPLLAGAILIVAGGLALIAERERPEHFRAIGLAYAFGCTVLFATRDNVVRHMRHLRDFVRLPPDRFEPLGLVAAHDAQVFVRRAIVPRRRSAKFSRPRRARSWRRRSAASVRTCCMASSRCSC